MRTQSEVEDRIRGILVLELDKRVLEATKRLPHLCRHNRQQPLDTRSLVEGMPNEYYNRVTVSPGVPVPQTMGLCMYGAEAPDIWPGDICEDEVDAKRCPYFNPRLTKEAIQSEFTNQLQQLDYVKERFPVVYELLWVLESQKVPHLPWWKRWLFALLRIRVEPPAVPLDPDKLLLPPSEQ